MLPACSPRFRSFSFYLSSFFPLLLLGPPNPRSAMTTQTRRTNRALWHIWQRTGVVGVVEERVVARFTVAPSFAREDKTGSIVCLNNCFGSEHFISSFCSSNMDHPLHIVAAKAGRQLRKMTQYSKSAFDDREGEGGIRFRSRIFLLYIECFLLINSINSS